MLAIIQDVIFPIMSHTEADQAQWDSDPYEYIRLKFGKLFLCGGHSGLRQTVCNFFIFVDHRPGLSMFGVHTEGGFHERNESSTVELLLRNSTVTLYRSPQVALFYGKFSDNIKPGV